MRLPAADLTELASGVDAFYLSGAGSLSMQLVEDLTQVRDEARELGSAVEYPFGADVFRVSGSGLQRYAFRLDHPRGVIALTPSAALPAVRVQPRAAFLHAVGAREGLGWFTELVESVLGRVVWKASRVDLFMDSHGWNLAADDRERFICRASQRVTYEDERLFTGLRFGSGKSGTAMARIYDKTEESRLKGTDWWMVKWGSGFRPGERVLRVEFQVGRELMRQVGISSPDEVFDELPGLWGYLTDEWLTFRDPNADGTSSRWPVAPEWRQIQAASLRSEAVGLDRVSAGEVAGSMRRLLPALRGYLASAGALRGSRTLDEALVAVGRVIAADEAQSGKLFSARLREKSLALGLS